MADLYQKVKPQFHSIIIPLEKRWFKNPEVFDAVVVAELKRYGLVVGDLIEVEAVTLYVREVSDVEAI